MKSKTEKPCVICGNSEFPIVGLLGKYAREFAGKGPAELGTGWESFLATLLEETRRLEQQIMGMIPEAKPCLRPAEQRTWHTNQVLLAFANVRDLYIVAQEALREGRFDTWTHPYHALVRYATKGRQRGFFEKVPACSFCWNHDAIERTQVILALKEGGE